MFNTRIAPSPTGDMHLGTARTAYFNYLAARASGGKFILRIDDTDMNRSNDTYTQVIFDTMKWLGLDYDTCFYQSRKIDRYHDCANQLLDSGKAKKVDGGAIALDLDSSMPRTWNDTISGDMEITDNSINKGITDLILIRSDGLPTYHFATVVDDNDSDINWIIRGTDHITNTDKHVAIYHAFGWKIPQYSHVGLLFNGKKMSKRDGAASMLGYRDKGYDPDALLNFMLRMGWGPTVDDKTTAMIDRNRAIELFIDHGKMKASKANFDQKKLDSFDRKYKGKKENENK